MPELLKLVTVALIEPLLVRYRFWAALTPNRPLMLPEAPLVRVRSPFANTAVPDPLIAPRLLMKPLAAVTKTPVPLRLCITPPLATFRVAFAPPRVTAVPDARRTSDRVAVEPAPRLTPFVAVIGPVRVTSPLMTTVPAPLTAPPNTGLSLRAKTSEPLLVSETGPRIEPAVPPAPICRRPVSMEVPPV